MDEREKLIAFISQNKALTHVNSATWACLWFADVVKLKELVYKLTSGRGECLYEALYTESVPRALKSRQYILSLPVLSHCHPYRANLSYLSIVVNMSDLTNEPLKTEGLLNPVAASIYLKLLKQKPGADFLKGQLDLWNIMRTCWHKETLIPWTAALFGLEPLKLTHGGKHLEARFFWLPKAEYNPSVPLMTRPSLAGDIECYRLGRQFGIKSGEVVVFKTDNPMIDPLPSWDLLHLQWTLNRVLAASGVIDLVEKDIGDDSSSESLVESFKSFEETNEENDDEGNDEEEDEVVTESSSEEEPAHDVGQGWILW
ncbi:hypothetical protein ASPCAL00791 [Aspergillus calidoustus]|uniref:HNH nuclease domain-containing protein n=1 Tax=Aspergillus calidoustus TaxID=454130 RepID=A0A0U5FPK5_ASPCI|nr:hypothetical protein ASPCAL00791 [Aspergillus calidoustus]